MKKVLIVASVISFIEWFNKENVDFLKNDIGCEVHLACNLDYLEDTDIERTKRYIEKIETDGIILHNVPFARSPLKPENIKAYKILKNIICSNSFDLIHCHTPVAAMITRLACRKVRKKGTKVFYTAHGFHFYKGAPKLNWLIYYPIEKICSYFTDVLITINKEDFALAQKKMKAKKVEYVPGVGIEVEKFANPGVTREQKREELGIPQDAKLLISVGELNRNKNHETVIKAIKDLDVYYLIAGRGDLQNHLQNLIDELNLSDRVKLLGYRTDVAELYAASDVFVFPSFREGLGLAAIESMAFGLPLIVADNRGTRDFCEKGINGFVCNPSLSNEFAKAIECILTDDSLKANMSQANIQKAKNFDVIPINDIMLAIYSIKR